MKEGRRTLLILVVRKESQSLYDSTIKTKFIATITIPQLDIRTNILSILFSLSQKCFISPSTQQKLYTQNVKLKVKKKRNGPNEVHELKSGNFHPVLLALLSFLDLPPAAGAAPGAPPGGASFLRVSRRRLVISWYRRSRYCGAVSCG